MNKNEWVCPKGHVFTLESGNFGDECRAYLEPKIGAVDSPCDDFISGCTEEMREGCVLTVAAHFEGDSVEC
jgi:hypothetical protein